MENFFCIFFKNKNLLLLNQSTMIKIRKFTMYAILLSVLIFISCLNNVFFFFSYVFGPGLNPEPHDAFGCQFDLIFFNLKLFLPFIFLSWPWLFFFGGGGQSTGQWFCRISSSFSRSNVWLYRVGLHVFRQNIIDWESMPPLPEPYNINFSQHWWSSSGQLVKVIFPSSL